MIWPDVDVAPVVLPQEVAVWDLLLDLTEAAPDNWTLIGGLMVVLHSAEHRVAPVRVTTDADTLINVRAVSYSLSKFVVVLENMHFKQDGVSPDGIGHRYRYGNLAVDVLAPEGVGQNKKLLHLKPPGQSRTIQVPGGTQALQRTENVPVRVGSRLGKIPRPSLLGAIIIKAESVGVDDLPAAQFSDLALLLSLVEDPLILVESLTKKDRKRLAIRKELGQRDHKAWALLSESDADRGAAAMRILLA